MPFHNNQITNNNNSPHKLFTSADFEDFYEPISNKNNSPKKLFTRADFEDFFEPISNNNNSNMNNFRNKNSTQANGINFNEKK